jgi:hypothetical protein
MERWRNGEREGMDGGMGRQSSMQTDRQADVKQTYTTKQGCGLMFISNQSKF